MCNRDPAFMATCRDSPAIATIRDILDARHCAGTQKAEDKIPVERRTISERVECARRLLRLHRELGSLLQLGEICGVHENGVDLLDDLALFLRVGGNLLPFRVVS